MSRKFTPNAGDTTHITIRCNNKEFLFNLAQNFTAMTSWLDCMPLFFNVRLHHVVFMTNHIHLLATPQENNLGQAMSYFLTNLSKYLNFSGNRTNHIFGNRYYPTIISNECHLINVIRYIYQNPVRAGIVNSIDKYPYSSLNFYLKGEFRGIVLEPDSFTKKMFDFGIPGLSSWSEHVGVALNQCDLSMMKKSLKRRIFRFSTEQYKLLSKGHCSLST